MHRHEVEPDDAGDRDEDPPRRRDRPDAGPGHREGRLLRRVLPRRLRHDPRRPRATCRPSPTPSSTTSRAPAPTSDPDHPTPWDVDRPAPPPLRRPGRGRPGRRVRRPRDRRALDAQPGARGRLPRRHLPRRRRRSTTTSARSTRRPATRSAASSAGPRRPATSGSTASADPLADLDAFIDLHQRRWGAGRPVPADAGRRRLADLHPPPVRGVRRHPARSGCRS